MRFSKYDDRTRRAARAGGAATARKWARIREERERAARRPQEEAAFKAFTDATAGVFDGFDMVNVFHERINKRDAVIVGVADDVATCYGVNVGADGVACYFFVLPEKVKKQVRFNRSVYLFGGKDEQKDHFPPLRASGQDLGCDGLGNQIK